MQCFESANSDQVIYMKEYNMWSDNIWKDLPRITPSKSEWADIPKSSASSSISTSPQWSDVPKLSPFQSCWSSPKRSPSNSPAWSTPPKSENPSLESVESSPRTSTPVDESSNEDLSESTDQYEFFKINLHGSPKNLKIRGAVVDENDSMISGHINMKNVDPMSYTFEHFYMPKINFCLLNLLINGPAPLVCQEHYDPKYPNPYVSNCQCIPVCNCRANIATNRNLPIGYKYNENGDVVASVPNLHPRYVPRDPNCIYTN